MKNLTIKIFVILITLAAVAEAKDRALLIGIDYYQQKGIPPTKGAVEDVNAVEKLLVNTLNFTPSSIKVLRNEEATTNNILRELDLIVNETTFGDRVFFQYAGHGYQVPDQPNGDEKDGLDEVITPYNIAVKKSFGGKVALSLGTGTYISDDTFNDYIAKLSGRGVVMLFDSCHSGTISRSLNVENKKYSRYLRLEEDLRGTADKDAYSYQPKDSGLRDLSVVKDTNLGDGNINGVVIISAASPYQEAFPVAVNNVLRGAVSYLFEQIMKNGNPTLRQIQTALTEKIKGGEFLRGSDGSFQTPQIEVLSKTDLWNQPLFGSAVINADNPQISSANYTVGLQSALTNQFSSLQVKLNLSNTVFHLGDQITYSVETGEEGYLYVLVFSADNAATCIFPATEKDEKTGIWQPLDVNNFLPKGQHNFPRTISQSLDDKYVTFAQDPIGKDVFVALLSKKKLPIGEKQNYTWNELFQNIGLHSLKNIVWEKTRGAGKKQLVRETAEQWQTAVVVIETVR